MTGRILDISPPVSPATAVWPGDVPYSRAASRALDDGDNIDLSAIHTTVHVGAHADAPSHTRAGAPAIDAVELSPYLGPCQVMRVAGATGPDRRIVPADLPGPIEAPRLLLATGTYPDAQRFDEGFTSLSPELVAHAAAAGVVLLGIDTPSVDPFDDALLLTHQALADHGVVNLEGLVLADVPPGRYTLIALPLRLVGADASPVRAVLLEGSPSP